MRANFQLMFGAVSLFAICLSGDRPATANGFAFVRPAERVLYRFLGPNHNDGDNPDTTLARDSSGALYGGTSSGSIHSACLFAPCGVIYKLAPTPSGRYSETIIHAFLGSPDGDGPSGPLTLDGTGALYGVTQTGGPAQYCYGVGGCGTVYKLTPSGSTYVETFPYLFQGLADGAIPDTNLILDRATGNIFGGTRGDETGPEANGEIFELIPGPSGYTQRVLYTFPRAFAGGASGLAQDAAGVIYGFDSNEVFALTPSSSGYSFSVLYTLSGHTGASISGPPRIGPDGTIYGTAVVRGDLKCAYHGCGTVFEVVHTHGGYIAKILHEFTGPPDDGRYPVNGVVMDKEGSLYGVTLQGGTHNKGIVFQLTRSKDRYVEQVLHNFGSTPHDGASPGGGLIIDAHGRLYGPTFSGGGRDCYYGDDCGTVFEITH